MPYDVGDWRTATLTVIPSSDGGAGPATDAALTVDLPDGTSASPTVSTSDDGATWTSAPYQLILPGRWTEKWTVTGTGKGVERATLDVIDPDASPLYADPAALRSALKVKEGALDDDRLINALRAASRAIDDHTGRPPGGFLPARTTAPRKFRVRGRLFADADGPGLMVDDIATEDGLSVDLPYGTGWQAWTGWETEPTPPGRPITILRGTWPTSGTVRITARWGWPTLPDKIAAATLIQATRLYKRPDSAEGVTGSAEWGVIRLARLDPDVAALTNVYTLPGFA